MFFRLLILVLLVSSPNYLVAGISCHSLFNKMFNFSFSSNETKAESFLSLRGAQKTAKLEKIFLSGDKKQLIAISQIPANRNWISNWIQEDFKRKSDLWHEDKDRGKWESIKTPLIGAGIHNTIVAKVLSDDPRWKQGGDQDFVIFDKGDKAISVFYEKDFRINSPELETGSANHIPNGFIQLKDFSPGERSAPARDLAFVFLVNLKVSGIKVILNTEATGLVAFFDGSVAISFATPNEKVSSFVEQSGFALGLGDVSTRSFINRDWVSDQISETNASLYFSPGIYTYEHFLAVLSYQLERNGPESLQFFDEAKIAIIGSHHSGLISAESFLGKLSDSMGRKLPKVGKEISMFGLRSQTSLEFSQEVHEKGSQFHSPLFIDRYLRFGIGEAIDEQFLKGIPERVVKVDSKNEKFDLTTIKGGKYKGYDLVILAPGNRDPVFSTFFLHAPEHPEELVAKMGLQNFESSGKIIARNLWAGPDPVNKHVNTRILFYGAGIPVLVPQFEIADSLTGSPNSINILGPRSAVVARQLADWTWGR